MIRPLARQSTIFSPSDLTGHCAIDSAPWGPTIATSTKTTPMRKIETQMNAAIANGNNWSSANTSVTFEGEVAEVRLHGNLIAKIGEGWIQLWDGGWQTTTTKSRLNAILSENGLPGERVFAKSFDWFVQQEGGAVPFFSGMRLA